MSYHGGPRKDVPMLIIEPAALFARTLQIAEVYEEWLEAQVQMFHALAVYSAASLRLFRAMSGRGAEDLAGFAHRTHHAAGGRDGRRSKSAKSRAA